MRELYGKSFLDDPPPRYRLPLFGDIFSSCRWCWCCVVSCSTRLFSVKSSTSLTRGPSSTSGTCSRALRRTRYSWRSLPLPWSFRCAFFFFWRPSSPSSFVLVFFNRKIIRSTVPGICIIFFAIFQLSIRVALDIWS